MLDKLDENAHLDHIMLASPDPQRLADFYTQMMDTVGSQINSETWLCEGPGRRILIQEGAEKTLGYGAYAMTNVAALEALKNRLASNGYSVQEFSSPIFESGSMSVEDPDSNTMVYGISGRSYRPESGRMSGRLQHLVVATNDVHPMVRFYENVIGAVLSDKVVDDDGNITACFFRTDQEHHSFAIFRAPEKRLDHHCYEAENWNAIRDWADRAVALGISIQWGPGRHGAGNNLFVFIHDPDGNWIEISAELEFIEPGKQTGIWRHETRTLNLWGHAKMRS